MKNYRVTFGKEAASHLKHWLQFEQAVWIYKNIFWQKY